MWLTDSQICILVLTSTSISGSLPDTSFLTPYHLKFTMITMSQTPDLSPKPAHFSQNSLPGQCLPDPAQPIVHSCIFPLGVSLVLPLTCSLQPQTQPSSCAFPARVWPHIPDESPDSPPLTQPLPWLYKYLPNYNMPSSRTPQLFSSVSRPLSLAFWGVVSAYLSSPPPPFPPSGSDSSEVPTDL